MKMPYLIVDVESTTKNKGHPFTRSNKLCLVGLQDHEDESMFKIEYDESPFGDHLDYIGRAIRRSNPIVGFNIKFDLHWLRRYGIDFSGLRVHDCQLAHFIQTNQLADYPSLDDVAAYWGLPQKLDVIERDYWSKGIDTPDIPLSVLFPYLKQDLFLTHEIYKRQVKWLDENPKIKKLFELQCEDLLVLEEMEWNGLLYDKEKSLKRANEFEYQSQKIIDGLNEVVGAKFVNWNSVDHVSSVLYGGTIKEAVREPFEFFYKDPKRSSIWKTRTVINEHLFPRLVEPLPNTELAKEGYWSSSSSTLMELHPTNKTGKRIIEGLLELSKLTKLNDYYKGLPELIDTMEWEDNILHGNLNQCVAVTGRLSSNKPNQQNMPEVVHELIKSRYEA